MTSHPGSPHGCLRQWEDLHAITDLVSPSQLSHAFFRPQYPPASSSNNPASLTSRLGATIDVEQNHVRFLGDLILNLWDCGGQDSFMDSYLTTQRSTIFQQVGVMIYVFDVESHEPGKDMEYYCDCLEGLRYFSPDAAIFILLHKMDLVREPQQVLEKKRQELEETSGDAVISVLGTTIFDQTLYKVSLNLFLRFFFLITSGVIGMVEYSPYPHPKRQHPLQTPLHLCASLRGNRSHPL